MVVPGLIGLTGWITVLIGVVGWMLLTLLLRKWPGTGLTPLVLTPVLSRLLALALGFELQVGGPENIWLISGGGSPASYLSGDMEVHHFRGWWTRTSEL
jgi:hypothetical protein